MLSGNGQILDYLRHVEIEALTGRKWQLRTWDTHSRDYRGQTTIGYEFISPEGTVLFTGEDFNGSPLHADDSDATLRSLLSFLTLHPGDTDREYFANYTAEQMAFAESYECEAMQLYGMDDLEDVPAFVNLDDWSNEDA